MANLKKRVVENVPGDFFVDATCIDCDACRQIAPDLFGEAADHSFVRRQPAFPSERRSAMHALLSCPTGSIGCLGGDNPRETVADFPLLVEDPVYFCGFNSPKSYGGNSYFVRHARGNWLVDSPKFVPPLVKAFEARGGVANIFLTHSDDVADAEKYARHFGSRRIIHWAELHSQPGAELVLDGEKPHRLAPDFLAIPTPGHTEGHCVLLFGDRILFTGDHLAWNRRERRLEAFEDYCWHSWEEQTASMRRLTPFRFEWILPGHGQRICLPAEEMQVQLRQLIASMKGRVATTNSRQPTVDIVQEASEESFPASDAPSWTPVVGP